MIILIPRYNLFIMYSENGSSRSSGSGPQLPNTLRPATCSSPQKHLPPRKPWSRGCSTGLLLILRQEVSRLLLICLRRSKFCQIKRTRRILLDSMFSWHSGLWHVLRQFQPTLQNLLQSQFGLRAIQGTLPSGKDEIPDPWNYRWSIVAWRHGRQIRSQGKTSQSEDSAQDVRFIQGTLLSSNSKAAEAHSKPFLLALLQSLQTLLEYRMYGIVSDTSTL